MKLVYRGSLQRTMIIYFVLIGFASSLVGIEFILDTHSQELRDALLQNFERLSGNEIQVDEAFQPVRSLRNKAILMVCIVMIVVAIVLMMFIKKITEPLQHMIETARKISAGDLSRTVAISTQNELSELGNVINDLTSNLQELLLLSQDVCTAGRHFIAEVEEIRRHPGMDAADVERLEAGQEALGKKVKMLGKIIRGFEVFRIGK